MSIDLSQLEAEFNRLNRGVNLDQLFEDANRLSQTRLVSKTSQLGFNPGQTVGGFQSLTSAIDDVVPSVTGSSPRQLIDRQAICQMTPGVPAISNRVIRSVEGAANDLSLITGTSAIDNGFLDVVISSSTPEAISTALGQVSDAPTEEVYQVASQLVDLTLPLSESITSTLSSAEDLFENTDIASLGGDIQNTLKQTVGTLQNSLSQVVNQANRAASNVIRDAETIFSNISNQITSSLANSNLGFGTISSNIVDKTSGVVLQAVNSIASVDNVAITVPPSVLTNVRAAIDNGDFSRAARELEGYSDRPLNEIEDVLRGINVTLASNLTTPGRGGGSVTTRRVGSNKLLWSEATTPDEAFSLIVTQEELEVELKSAQREITEIIVHWTETNINQDIGAEEIHRFAAENGVGIPYHYIIRRDGSLQRGRPIDEIGGPLINNHDQYSIQIAFVGGINAPSEVEEINRFLSKDSLNIEQMKTFKVFLQKSYSAWPGVQVLGHEEIDRNHRDPGFNVTTYVQDVFQKQSIYIDAYTQSAYNRQQLTTTRLPDWDYT
jgi:N-acetylmuramoyl-L-alanine amidase